MLINRENCPLRHANGNCLPVGGFCTSVNDQICGGLRQAYDHGRAKMVGPHWISVKDRLPEQAGYKCLVSAEYGDGKRTVFTAFTGYGKPGWWTYEVIYMEQVRHSDNRVHHNYHITHWMPLPEPPKEDEA